jgi:hypothetical protein
MKNGSSDDGIFGMRPDVRRLEAQHYIAFGDPRLFKSFGDSQIGVVGLKPDFPIDDLQTDHGPMNAPRPFPTFVLQLRSV